MSAWSEAAGRAVVYQRSMGRCEVCTRPAATFHHRVKRGQGGSWAPSNGLHLCGDGTRYCHGWIEGNPRHAMALGLWLRAGSVPADWPLYCRPALFHRGWWQMDDDGCWRFTDPPADWNLRPEVAAALTALHAARLDTPAPILPVL